MTSTTPSGWLTMRAGAGFGSQRDPDPLGGHPLREAVVTWSISATVEPDLGGVGLDRRFAEIGRQRGRLALLLLHEQPAELADQSDRCPCSVRTPSAMPARRRLTMSLTVLDGVIPSSLHVGTHRWPGSRFELDEDELSSCGMRAVPAAFARRSG